MPPDYNELKRSLDKQSELLEENNKMLHRLRRYQTLALVFSILWYGLLIGLPFALFYYIVGPYFEALGISTDEFNSSLHSFPGYQQFESFFGLNK